ncbi:MAG: phytanoyl-CoA dioxygenase family protein, partial [Saprospiraceae bacterium]
MPVLSPAEQQQFQQQGFLLIPQVYAPADLLVARAHFQKAFLENTPYHGRFDSDTLLTDVYRHFPGLEQVVFNERTKDVARGLLGPEAALIPECAVHRERYPHWHKDTTFQEMAGLTSHCDRNAPPILQFATYFQENSQNGGGLTVIPGTQHQPDPFLELYSSRWSKRLWNKVLKVLRRSVFDALERHPDKTDIPHQLGDLLVFDLRIFHRATCRSRQDGPEKFAIFNTWVQPRGAGLDYFRFMKQRPEPYYQYF